jgi:hypothetical protein
LGAVAGPLIGGTVSIPLLPAPGSPFAIVAIVLAIAVSGVASFPQWRQTQQAQRHASAPKRKGRVIFNSPLLVGSGLSALGWGAAGFSLGILPSAVDHLLPGETAMATIAVTVLMSTSLTVQLVGLRWRFLLQPRIALMTIPAGSLAIASALLFEVPVIAYVGAFIGGIGLGCAFVTGASLAAAGANEFNRAAMMSLFFTITQLSSGLPAFIIGIVFAPTELGIGAAALSGALVLGAIGLWGPVSRVQEAVGTNRPTISGS